MGVTWWNLQSRLMVAIQNDDEIKVKQLLAAGVDCDVRFYSGSIRSPALCLCVERDSFSLGISFTAMSSNLKNITKRAFNLERSQNILKNP